MPMGVQVWAKDSCEQNPPTGEPDMKHSFPPPEQCGEGCVKE